MLHRSYMRRGVSLEVIVEEDDHAEVSLDPIQFEDDIDSSPHSSTSSTGADTEVERERNRESKRERRTRKKERKHSLKEKRKRLKEREEEERWRFLQRQRSLSCETLTILDVGDDDFSREQWEEEAREWDSADDGNGSEREIIRHCISRRKILEEASRNQNQYVYGENQETLSDEGEFEISDQVPGGMETRGTPDGTDGEAEVNDTSVWNSDKEADIIEDFSSENSGDFYAYQVKVENRDEIDSLEGDSSLMTENIYDDVPITETRAQMESKSNGDLGSYNIPVTDYGSRIPKFPKKELWLQETATNDEDAWITVGELENGIQENKETGIKLEQGLVHPKTTDHEYSKNTETGNKLEQGLVLPKTTDHEHSKLEPNLPTSEDFELMNEVHEDDVDSVQSDITVTIEESIMPENSQPPVLDLQGNILSVKNRKDFFENKQTNERNYSPLADRLLTALANPEVLIIERSPSPKEDVIQSSSDEENTELQMPYNVHNMELHPEELPPPNTVSSVRQIFEIIPAAPQASTLFELPCRYDHVRSNPTSKILRFERDRRNQTSTSFLNELVALKQEKEVSYPSTVNNTDWQNPIGTELNYDCNSTESTSPSNTSTKSSGSLTNSTISSTNSTISSTNSISSTNPTINSTNSTISSTNSMSLTNSTIISTNSTINSTNSTISSTNSMSLTNSTINSSNSTRNSSNSTNLSITSSTGVNLRKPRVVSKFDVRKALQDNPRYFHIRVEGKETKVDGKGTKNGPENEKRGQKNSLGRRNTITYSYLEAKHQKQRGTATTLRWTRETIDRSDAESMSSESSEDSGVSRDFSSSILSSFSSSSKKKGKSQWSCPRFIKQEYASDPSFKWIDPSVLSKIRSMGTTVIYFGPRRRPQPGIHPRYMKRATSPLKPTKENYPMMLKNNDNDNETDSNNETMVESSYNHTRQGPECGSEFGQTQTEISLLKEEQRRKSTGNNSIVYDFTQKQISNGYD